MRSLRLPVTGIPASLDSEALDACALPSTLPSMDLTQLLLQDEGKTLEFKRDLSSRTGILRSIVAFANTAGGRLLIGVEDRTRNVLGVADPLDTEERIANLISDAIEPRLVPDIEILPWRRTHVLLINVHPSASRPHFVNREGEERGTYVRVGSTNRRADDALRAELRRYASRESHDEQAIPDLDSEAIDFRAASESFRPVRDLKQRDLETLRLLTKHQGRLVPTIGGMLLFGSERLEHFPDAWIQFGQFAGTDKGKIIDSAELRDYPVRAIERTIERIAERLRKRADIGHVRREDRWDIPPIAIREAVVNAVAHADYSQRGAPIRIALFDDRLEVENPGLLPPGITVDDIKQGISKLRNRVIGRVFHELGLVEQWGSGIQRMMAACRDAGLPEPVFEEIGMRFRVTLPMERSGEPVLDPTDRAILDFLADGDGRSTADVAEHIGISTRATRTRLGALVDRGFARVIGSGPQDPRRKYFRSDSQ